jgi:hypothetical protein
MTSRPSTPSNPDSDYNPNSKDEGGEDPSDASSSFAGNKRRRGCARDVQVARMAGEERMAAVPKAAELKEAAAMRVVQASHELKLALLEKATLSAWEVAGEDRSIAREQLTLAHEAKEAITAAHDVRLQSTEVVEMTKIFAAQGRNPMQAVIGGADRV